MESGRGVEEKRDTETLDLRRTFCSEKETNGSGEREPWSRLSTHTHTHARTKLLDSPPFLL